MDGTEDDEIYWGEKRDSSEDTGKVEIEEDDTSYTVSDEDLLHCHVKVLDLLWCVNIITYLPVHKIPYTVYLFLCFVIICYIKFLVPLNANINANIPL